MMKKVERVVDQTEERSSITCRNGHLREALFGHNHIGDCIADRVSPGQDRDPKKRLRNVEDDSDRLLS